MKPNLFSLSRLLCEMLSQGVFGDSKQFEAVFSDLPVPQTRIRRCRQMGAWSRNLPKSEQRVGNVR